MTIDIVRSRTRNHFIQQFIDNIHKPVRRFFWLDFFQFNSLLLLHFVDQCKRRALMRQSIHKIEIFL